MILEASGTLNSQNPAVGANGYLMPIPCEGKFGAASFQITGAWAGQIEFEVSNDGVNFVSLNATKSDGTGSATHATGNGMWFANIASAKYVQMRMSTFISGAAAAFMTVSLAPASGTSSGGGGSSDASAANQVIGNGYLASLIAQIFDFDTSGGTSNGVAFGLLTPGNPPVPVSSSNPLPTYTGPVTAIAPAAASVTNASGAAVALNASRKYVDLCNADASKTIYLGFGANAAVVGSGITLAPGATARIQTTQAINGIADASGGANLSIQEWQ